jgi:hypothetical protein
MEVHEHPLLNGSVGEIAEPIEHQDFRGLHHHIAQHNEYSSWEAHRYMALINDSVGWDRLTPRQKLKYRNLRCWWYAPIYFAATYFGKRGFLDGGPGFFYAMTKFTYFFEVRAKILEAERCCRELSDAREPGESRSAPIQAIGRRRRQTSAS